MSLSRFAAILTSNKSNEIVASLFRAVLKQYKIVGTALSLGDVGFKFRNRLLELLLIFKRNVAYHVAKFDPARAFAALNSVSGPRLVVQPL